MPGGAFSPNTPKVGSFLVVWYHYVLIVCEVVFGPRGHTGNQAVILLVVRHNPYPFLVNSKQTRFIMIDSNRDAGRSGVGPGPAHGVRSGNP